jgi:hypothetical protein
LNTKEKSAKYSEGINFALVIIVNGSSVAASATRAWLVGIAAHPATQATMKAAVLTANNVLAIWVLPARFLISAGEVGHKDARALWRTSQANEENPRAAWANPASGRGQFEERNPRNMDERGAFYRWCVQPRCFSMKGVSYAFQAFGHRQCGSSDNGGHGCMGTK